MTVSTNAVQQAVLQTLVPSAPSPTVETLPANETLQNEPTPLEILTQSFLRDLNPRNAIEHHIATRLAEIAHRQNCLSACESQVLQNEAARSYDNQLIRWRQARQDHIEMYGYHDKEHPAPEKPAPEPQTPLSLLAHAFSPTLQHPDAPATKKPPVLSPTERYFHCQNSLDAQFQRFLKTYRQLQNEPISGVDVHVDTSSVGTPSEDYPILQNKPKVPSAPSPTVELPIAPTLPILQNEPLGAPSACSGPSSPSFPPTPILQNTLSSPS